MNTMAQMQEDEEALANLRAKTLTLPQLQAWLKAQYDIAAQQVDEAEHPGVRDYFLQQMPTLQRIIKIIEEGKLPPPPTRPVTHADDER